MEEKEVLVTNDPVISKYTSKSWFKSCILGFLIGLAIIVPGISGSTISILFKLYDKLLYAISNIFKKFKVCVLFLLPILIGGILGIILGFFSVKKLLEIKLLKNSSNKLEEQISLDLLYNKVFMQIIDVKEEEDKSNIYSVFESELGRTLSPIEYELINGWLECNYKEEIILAALKEAVFNGVNNFRYIDRILFEWNKKGIDTVDKISKYKKEFRKDTNVEVPDYDWLNDK